MKKIFLLFGVAAVTSAAAQQKDLFDIQKYLQEKNKALFPKPAEKVPLLPLSQHYVAPAISTPDNVYVLSNGDEVLFGNGRMPCIKPNMELYVTMPNAAVPYVSFSLPFYTKPGEIPNGALPYKLYFTIE